VRSFLVVGPCEHFDEEIEAKKGGFEEKIYILSRDMIKSMH